MSSRSKDHTLCAEASHLQVLPKAQHLTRVQECQAERQKNLRICLIRDREDHLLALLREREKLLSSDLRLASGGYERGGEGDTSPQREGRGGRRAKGERHAVGDKALEEEQRWLASLMI